MKSIRTKIILSICTLVIVSMAIIGSTVSYLMYTSSIDTLKQTMTETANTAAGYVDQAITTYHTLLNEISLLTRLTSSDYSYEQRGQIVAEKAKTYHFDDAGYITLEGIAYPGGLNFSNREYFVASKRGEFYLSEPFMSDVYNRMVIVMSAPVMKNNQVDAVIFITLDANFLSQITNTITVGKTGSAYMIDSKGVTISHKDESLVINKDNMIEAAKTNKSLAALGALEEKMIKGESGFGIYGYGGQKKALAYAPITNSKNWSIGISTALSDFLGSTYTAIYITIFLVLLALVASVVSAIVLANSILKPIKEIEKVAGDIAKGNLNVNLQVRGQDEISMLTKSFIKLKNTILLLISKINEMAGELDKGDIEARIPETEFEGEFRAVAFSINSTVNALINDTLAILAAYTALGNGNFKAELIKLPAKKGLVNEEFDKLKATLNALSGDVQRLISGAIDGNLHARADASLYKEDWKKIAEGLNNLLQAVNTPIDEANEVLAQLSNGNFNVSVGKAYKGSFGSMMSAFDQMVDSIGSYICEITQMLDTIAAGDLQKKITRDYVGQFNAIKESINQIFDTLKGTVSEIKSSADNVLSGAKQISESSMDLANGASTQASSVEELNASIIAINEKAQHTAQKAQEANGLSQKSILNAKDGNEEMTKMLKSMDEIKIASNNIYKIIKVIDDIAFQTNLLALNAAVEAARAGEHGKGFSVVAEEVRSLAGRSLAAAKDTSQLIEDTIHKVNEGMQTARLTADSLNKIVVDTNSVSEIIDNIYTATKEQTESISQITEGVNQISEIVQRNSSTSEESAAAAQELNSQSEVLAQMVSKFKV